MTWGERLDNVVLRAAGRWLVPAPQRVPTGPGKTAAYRLRNAGLERWPVHAVRDVPGVGAIDCDTRDVIQRYLYVFGVWEPTITSLVRQHLQPGDVFVDVGANIGYYSLLAAQLVGPTGKVISFEPSPTVRAQLEANIARNHLADRVIVNAAAAGAEPGDVELFLAGEGNLGQTSTRSAPGFTTEGRVPLVRVDIGSRPSCGRACAA